MTDDRTSRAILETVNSWIDNRSRIVDARSKAEEAGIFTASQGTHMNFLQQLTAHSNMIAGTMPLMNPIQIEALQELVSAWASMVAQRSAK